jgi:Holliday junction resolvase YEN1
VDAVWTDDGDALMFGTTVLIRTHREKGGEKSKTHVNVYRADQLKEQYGLDRDGFALFALLAGGDSETQGLPRCGPSTAMRLARDGIGQSLRGLPKERMHIWRQHLQVALHGKCEVPPDFPNVRALNYYMNTAVSSTKQLHNLRGLAEGWDVPLKEAELRSFLRTHYNIQIKGYMKHIIPILLLRTLCATTPGLERTNNIYGIELAKVRKKKTVCEHATSLVRKITFLPQQVTSLDLSTQPGGPDGEDWTTLLSKNGTRFDATARIDCEMLEYALK